MTKLNPRQPVPGVSLTEGGLPVGIRAERQGIEFNVGWGIGSTDVEIAVEYPDHSGMTTRTDERYVTLTREQWEAIVAFIAAEMTERTADA